MKTNWSQSFLLPVGMEMKGAAIVLRAGGESVCFNGDLFRADSDQPVRSRWKVSQRKGMLTVELELTAIKTMLLRSIAWFAGEWESAVSRQIASTRVQDNVLFLRKYNVSFFLSLDFPYSRITDAGISYPACEYLPAETRYAAHSLTIGACRRSGITVGKLDRAEIEAFSEYTEKRFPPRFERPQFISCCITNRYTDVREGRIFYTMRDNPTLFLNPDLLAEDIRLLAQIGVEYYQMFEGIFDWPDHKHTGQALRRLVRLGRQLGVRVGGYVAGRLYCSHYNYTHNSYERLIERLGKTEWFRINDRGERDGLCLGCAGYLDYLTRTLVAHSRKYGEEMICFDFWSVIPCHATGHGHPPGDMYRQVLGMVRLMQALNAISPNYLIWTNLGVFQDLMPKLTWFNPNCYFTDPHARSYAPGLNALKLMGDWRREQMVTLHDRDAVPWRNFSNCEYYLSPGSRVPDWRTFEYSFLQGLAVTPNICPAETRPFLERLPRERRAACLAFMRRWLAFIRAHFDVWQHTARVGPAPGSAQAEIYAHVKSRHGFVCLVNPHPFPRLARFRLDDSIGLSGGERFQIYEIYPNRCLIAEQTLPFAVTGDEILCRLPPQSVRYLEIQPYREPRGIQVSGLPARTLRTTTGWRLELRAPQGQTVRIGVTLPPGQRVVAVTARQTPTVPMFTFPAAAKIVSRQGPHAFMDVSFPREPAPRALTRWTLEPAHIRMNLPASDQGAFLGGLVHGAFTEDLEVQVDLTIGSSRRDDSLRPPPTVATRPLARWPVRGRYRMRTEFVLPFIERRGLAPLDEEPIVELAFADVSRIESLAARVNGQPVNVQRYYYPRSKENWYTPYLELMGAARAGKVTLEIEWTMKDSRRVR